MIYIVTGYTGEYSDHQNWNVKAFINKKDADNLCDKLKEWLLENECQYGGSNPNDLSLGGCPLDKHFRCDYTGTSYGVEEVESDAI